MEMAKAASMARELMDGHGLRGWRLDFDRARRRAGRDMLSARSLCLRSSFRCARSIRCGTRSSTRSPTRSWGPSTDTAPCGKRRPSNSGPCPGRRRAACRRLPRRGSDGARKATRSSASADRGPRSRAPSARPVSTSASSCAGCGDKGNAPPDADCGRTFHAGRIRC